MSYGYRAIIILNSDDPNMSRARTMTMTVTSAEIRRNLRIALSNGDKKIDDIFQAIDDGEEEGYYLPPEIITNADIHHETNEINNQEVNGGCISDIFEIRKYMRNEGGRLNFNMSLYIEAY